jgi:hypothetical protein
MKTAYELAMERLNQSAPTVSLTAAQKREIADLETRCKAKMAEREIALQSEIRSAQEQGDHEAAEKLRSQLSVERQRLRADLEAKKEAVRQISGR